MALLTVENLTLGYEGITVAEDLTFSVNSGDYLCIVGENGSGKTTLMKTILNLMKPLSGRVATGEGLQPAAIGYLPQQTQVQKDFPASVREVVLSGSLNKSGFNPFYTKVQKRQARDNMERLGILPLATKCYRELSGGQQQSVLLARALGAADRMLLLDEPAAGLDPQITEDMYMLIRQLNESGLTILMISHDIHAAARYASHILHVSRRPLFYGTKEDYVLSDIGQQYGCKVAV